MSFPGLFRAKSFSVAPAIGMVFYPTILELAELPLKPKQHVDGISWVPD